jgi:signal transduction histidine kinase
MTTHAETIIVIIANGATAILAAAVMLLVLWQGGTQRLNQALGIAMFCLTFYCTLNAIARFTKPIGLPTDIVYYTLLSVYGCFTFALFVFILLLAGIHGRDLKIWLTYGMVVMPIALLLTWAGLVVVDLRVTVEGGITFRYGPLYFLGFMATALPTLISLPLLLRSQYPWRKQIALALLCTFAGIFASPLRPFIGNFPINAVGLAISTYLIGQTVFQSQVFNPLSEMNAQYQQKNLELQQASHLKSQFMSNISRDLRAPLNTIIGYSSLVIEGTYGPLTTKQRDRMQKVHANSQHLLNLVSDILDLNQMETGQLSLTVGEYPVAAVVEPVWAMAEPLAQKKNLPLERHLPDDLPPLRVDDQRARQVLINLLSNAIKFTSYGSVQLRVSAEARFVRFEVQDTGIGIAQHDHESIFEPFVQGDSSATREFEGTGLGLSICQRLVEMHGGKIWFNSELGRGTTFFVTFPRADVA